jgi:hypothetical protein
MCACFECLFVDLKMTKRENRVDHEKMKGRNMQWQLVGKERKGG